VLIQFGTYRPNPPCKNLFIDGEAYQILDGETIAHAISRITGVKYDERVVCGKVRLYYEADGKTVCVMDRADWKSEFIFEFLIPEGEVKSGGDTR
jgi:hypothetical protein